jgi:hypothetical protein
MTIAEVRFHIEEIRALKGRDTEGAHSLEDDLFQHVLTTIAKGSKKSRKLAQEALKSLKIKFARHCA